MIELATARLGDPAYAELLVPAWAPECLARIWADAESRPHLERDPATQWCVVTVEHDGHRVAAAWAAATVTEIAGMPVLRCHDSYEMPQWRGRGLYTLAYAYRQATVVIPAGKPAVSWIFDQPLALHLATGWQITGDGVSAEPGTDAHHWSRVEFGV